MTIAIQPSNLHGVLPAIASKSVAHRMFICAALCDSPTEIILSSFSEDIGATLHCLQTLGVSIKQNGNVFTVTPAQTATGNATLNPKESGSTLRFLLPVAALLSQQVTFTGEGRLAQRPLDPLLEVLEKNGCVFSQKELPLTMVGDLRGGVFSLPGNITSQYISGLLLALPLVQEDSRLVLTTPLESAAYVAMTIATLNSFGIKIESAGNGYIVPGKQQYVSPQRIAVEGDWSNAAFFLAAGAMKQAVTISNLNLNSLQADSKIIQLLKDFGAVVTTNGDAVTVSPGKLQPQMIDVSSCPDLFPILSVLACSCQGETVLCNCSRLRLKESDRIASVSKMLQDLGGEVREEADTMIIVGHGSLKGGTVDVCHDHRIAMAAAIAATICTNPVIIQEQEVVNKSYPDFYRDLQILGGRVDVL